MTEIETPESMTALADFCSDLYEAKLNEWGKECCQEYSLEVNIDADTSALEIRLSFAEGGVPYRRDLLLWVEKDTLTSDLSLRSRAGDLEERYPPMIDCELRSSAVKVKQPYARSLLVDIHLGREADYYYVHLLVADGDQTAKACQPVPVRFQLGAQGCYQLGDSSHSPAVVPVDTFLNPPPEKPRLLTADFSAGIVLPWPVALGLLMLASALVGWLCAVAGQAQEGTVPTMMTLMFLLGTVPFFSRHIGGYTLTGLLIVTAGGVLVSLLGFLFKGNVAVLPFMVMGALLSVVFRHNAYGRAKAVLIDLEKSQVGVSRFLATRTEQEQNMLQIGDFFIVLVAAALLVWLYSSVKP